MPVVPMKSNVMRRQAAKLDKGFVLVGMVIDAGTGESRSGDDYYRLRVGGYTFFVDREWYEAVELGDMVVIRGEYLHDRYNRQTSSYSPQFELESMEIIESLDDVKMLLSAPSVQAESDIKASNSNGNGALPRVNA